MRGKKLNINMDKDNEGKTIREFLLSLKLSKKTIYSLFQTNSILLNNKTVKENETLSTMDIVTLVIEDSEIDYACDENEAHVVYEDDLVCVVHKDAGCIVHEDDKNKTGTLSNQVATYYARKGYSIPVRYIHRLDEDTQGLVLFCKVPVLQAWFDEELMNKNIERTYHAIVHGEVDGKSFIIKKPIGRDRHDARKMRISSTGKEAITHIRVLEKKEGYSRVECKLETGRTHQIRVHMAAIGHSVVNDRLYGFRSMKYKGMCLFAMTLSWIDPLTKEKRTVSDSLINYLF